MYPNLVVPLVAITGLGGFALVVIAIGQPTSRRLALRQMMRRRGEAALVIAGSVLGISIIVGALVVGDTLAFSVRQEAYRTLGPIDERIVAASPDLGQQLAARLGTLQTRGTVDGVLSASIEQAAAVSSTGRTAEPRVLAWDIDFSAASKFGDSGGQSGLGGPPPGAGQVVINEPLARSLHAGPGQRITLLLYGRPVSLQVTRVLPESGLAGAGLGAEVNDNAFLPPGLLAESARLSGQPPTSVTLVSNRGGVEGGNNLTEAVTAEIRSALGPLASQVTVQTPKHDVLKAAKTTGDALGSLFLMIGSFSIIAGALLLVNIFVMLGEERKSQLGMLRAVGMKRSSLVGSFTLEGAGYAALSIIPGIVIGVAVGWSVALIAAEIFKSWSATGTGLRIAFAVTPTSLVNGTAMGLIIALGTVVVTSVRVSRFNVIAAIRDLPTDNASRPRRVSASAALAVLCGLAAIPAVAHSQPELTYLLPSLAALFSVPILQRFMSRRGALSLAAGGVLIWSLVASVLRPHLFDTPSMVVYVLLGSLTAFSSVVLISQNQTVVLRPFRRFLRRPSEGGVAARLAVSYPLAKPFRTGATLVMYTLIMLVLVLLTEITGIMNSSIDRTVADATSGYALRVDFNPQSSGSLLSGLHDSTIGREISTITPLLSATGQATDPGHRTKALLATVAVGVPPAATEGIVFGKRLPGLKTDADVWTALQSNTRNVALDPYFGSNGGPNGQYYKPGDQMTAIDPLSGRSETLTIVGIMKSGMVFYPRGAGATTYPLITSATSVRDLYGSAAQVSSALVRTTPGVSADQLSPRLQAAYLPSSLVATPLATNIRHLFAANVAFFRLMQGFLALGLIVGVTGLGVVMVRAVRERRRTIGVLRALGFRARTVERSFLTESGFIAIEGIALGAILGVLTTWLMYQKSSAFAGLEGAFPVEWATIAILCIATFLASILATLGPARRAAHTRPAVAVRVSE